MRLIQIHLLLLLHVFAPLGKAAHTFQAGAATIDISPTNFPVLVNAMFNERAATQTVDRLTARALVLDDGTNRLVLAVVDTCMMPRGLIDQAKQSASRRTKIPTANMLVSATHTHSAPSAMGCLGSRADTNYAAFLPGRIAEAIIQAAANLQPARIGWTAVDDWDHTFNRRWVRRADRMLEDPFGERTVRAHMHPGHESPDVTGPSGTVDPALSVLALATPEGKPLALLANYSQHYYGSPLLSSDYFGRFTRHITSMLGATNSSFVAMMSQGTSGDLMWMDYGAPRKEIGYDAYAKEMAARVHQAYAQIQFRDWVPLRSAERTLQLKYRVPDADRLAWAVRVAAGLKDRLPQTQPEIYALEATYLHERPETELLLQAIRIGDLGIAAIPNEVFTLTGLKLKVQSPFALTMNIELANGAEGYIPPPEQHRLGGYTTWPARTAGLEISAEPRIVETLLGLLEEISGQPRRKLLIHHGTYARAVLASRPRAFWRFEEMNIPIARDSTTNENNARFEGGLALYLPGAGSGEGISPNPQLNPSSFSGPEQINRAIHLAGGRVQALLELPETYSVELWFWKGTKEDREGTLFARGPDHLKLATALRFGTSAGKTAILPRQWHHALFTRAGSQIRVYLNGVLEISSEAAPSRLTSEWFFGGAPVPGAEFEGKLDELALYDRALDASEARGHFRNSGL